MCYDFEDKLELDKKFDYIVIYNSIPHFSNLDEVFQNVQRLLKKGGTFAIIHGKTRERLNQHHIKIGYNHGREPIPLDTTLQKLVNRYHMKELTIRDVEYFFFSCKY